MNPPSELRAGAARTLGMQYLWGSAKNALNRDKKVIIGMHNPPHPGEIMRVFCVDALNITVTDAAKSLGVTRKTFSALLNAKAGISPEMALRLSKVFGRSPEGWMKLQLQYDLWKAQNRLDLGSLKRLEAEQLVG
jgi:antitoxin HigA-1